MSSPRTITANPATLGIFALVAVVLAVVGFVAASAVTAPSDIAVTPTPTSTAPAPADSPAPSGTIDQTFTPGDAGEFAEGDDRAIAAAVLGAYDGELTLDERAGFVRDGSSVLDAMQRAAINAPSVVPVTKARVDNIIRIGDNKAVVDAALSVGSAGVERRQFVVVRVAGQWFVARASLCADLTLLQAPCGADPDPTIDESLPSGINEIFDQGPPAGP